MFNWIIRISSQIKCLIKFGTITIVICIATLNCRGEKSATRIGVITDLSGNMATWGQQTRLGAEIFADEVRAQGKEVEVIFGDHSIDTKKAVSEAQKMLYVDNVSAVYSEFTPTTVAISPVVKGAKRVMVYIAGARSLLKDNPYSFKSHNDFSDSCRGVAEYWKKRGIKQVGILKPNVEASELCLNGAKQVYPDIFVQEFALGGDVSTQVLLLKQHNVEAIFLPAYENDTLNMIKAMLVLQYMVPFAGLDNAITQKVVDMYPQAIENAIKIGLPDISAEFAEKVKVRDPKNSLVSIEAAALAYIHLKQMYAAIEMCGVDHIDCQISAMEKSKADSALSFTGYADRVAQFPAYLRRFKGSELQKIEVVR